jgi:putative ABC transport system permease protein
MFQELRHAARALRATPGQAVGAVIVLAVGLGATTAIYTLIDRVLLHPVDIQDPGRVVRFFEKRSSGPPSEGFVYSEWLERRSSLQSFEGIAAYGEPGIGQTLLERGDHTIAVDALAVSSNYFAVIGTSMARGTGLLAEHDRPGAAAVAVLSDRAWRTLFDSAPDIVGRSIHLNDALLTVVGVAPPGAHSPEVGGGPDLFVSLRSVPLLSSVPMTFFDTEPVEGFSPLAWMKLIGRLKAGVTVERAEAETEFRQRSRLLANGVPPDRITRAAQLLPLTLAALPLQTRSETASFLSLLGGTVGLLLLLTCATVAALLLARIERRRRDLAVRAALGARPGKLVRLALTEALIVALVGGVLSLAVSRTLLKTLSAFSLPGVASIGSLALDPDLRVALFSVAVALLTALACGLVPGWQSARTDVVTHLTSRPGSTGRGRFTLQAPLAAAQVAVALTLLVGASLFVRTIKSVLNRDLGFASQQLLTVTPTAAGLRGSLEGFEALLPDTLARLQATPGIAAVAWGPAPFGPGGGWPSIKVDGKDVRLPTGQRFFMDAVGGGYLAAIGVPVLTGRGILEGDQAGGATVAVVNQSFAQKFWPGETVVGRRFHFLPFTQDFEIVGLAQDARFRDLDSGPIPCVYLPRGQVLPIFRKSGIVIRTTAGAAPMSAAVTRELAQAWPHEFEPNVATISDIVADRLKPQRLAVAVLGWLGALAALVAVLGVSSLVASGVAQRTHEIGVRVSLGASRARVLALVARQGLISLAAGGAGGLLAAALARNLIRAFLRDIGPLDPGSFAAAAGLLLGAAGLGVGVAAWRALRIDPATALRAE